MRTVISLETGRPAIADDSPSGVAGFIGWVRLAATLQRAGEVRPSESVTHFAVTDRGLEFFVKTPETPSR